jgi:hypothetical protein
MHDKTFWSCTDDPTRLVFESFKNLVLLQSLEGNFIARKQKDINPADDTLPCHL